MVSSTYYKTNNIRRIYYSVSFIQIAILSDFIHTQKLKCITWLNRSQEADSGKRREGKIRAQTKSKESVSVSTLRVPPILCSPLSERLQHDTCFLELNHVCC